MIINVRFNLDPKDQQSRELIELLKKVAETELVRRQSRSSGNPVDWVLDATNSLCDKLCGAVMGKAGKLAIGSGLVKRSKQDGLT
jgi:hypothetical protein